MRLALATLNPTVGAVEPNADLIIAALDQARAARADLVITPELVVSGYPPRDLLLHEGFVEACERATERVAHAARGLVALVGSPWRADAGRAVANSVAVLRDGRVAARYDKRLLPTYDVFDETRYFAPGRAPLVIDVAGVRVGVAVCEDLWRGFDAGVSARYRAQPDPVEELVRAGATLIANPSASPFALKKTRAQREILVEHARRRRVALAAVNQVGGNDDLIFSGHSAVYVPTREGARLVGAAPGYEAGVTLVDLGAGAPGWEGPHEVEDPLLSAPPEELLWKSLTLGIRDYCRKTGFRSVVLGLSGGVDSALTACVASGALGPEHVLAVCMPSRHSSAGSLTDARALAASLGVRCVTAPIEGPHASLEGLLAPAWREVGAEATPGVTEENVQARLRGLILMAFSNKTGALPLTTGNKSELGVGYCTLYGDMNGGLAVISDLTKAQVYALARWVNANPSLTGLPRAPIPQSTLTKAPSAELRPDQTDQETLPPYDVVDEVVERYVNARQAVATIVRETGRPRDVVERLVRMIDSSEHKRRQAALGRKVSDVAFGAGRRMPIAQGWTHAARR